MPTFLYTLSNLHAIFNFTLPPFTVLVRASGTEPVIRVMIEGEKKKTITLMADELGDIIAQARPV